MGLSTSTYGFVKQVFGIVQHFNSNNLASKLFPLVNPVPCINIPFLINAKYFCDAFIKVIKDHNTLIENNK